MSADKEVFCFVVSFSRRQHQEGRERKESIRKRWRMHKSIGSIVVAVTMKICFSSSRETIFADIVAGTLTVT